MGVATGAVAPANTGAGFSSLGTLACFANAFGAAALQLSTRTDTVVVAVRALRGDTRVVFLIEGSVENGSLSPSQHTLLTS